MSTRQEIAEAEARITARISQTLDETALARVEANLGEAGLGIYWSGRVYGLVTALRFEREKTQALLNRFESLVTLLYPEEMTPIAQRQFRAVIRDERSE